MFVMKKYKQCQLLWFSHLAYHKCYYIHCLSFQMPMVEDTFKRVLNIGLLMHKSMDVQSFKGIIQITKHKIV
jgi:hypothetical protein